MYYMYYFGENWQPQTLVILRNLSLSDNGSTSYHVYIKHQCTDLGIYSYMRTPCINLLYKDYFQHIDWHIDQYTKGLWTRMTKMFASEYSKLWWMNTQENYCSIIVRFTMFELWNCTFYHLEAHLELSSSISMWLRCLLYRTLFVKV